MSYIFKQKMVPSSKSKYKCPYDMQPDGIVIHNTANDASAENEVKYMNSNTNYVSYHVAIDDKEVIQAIPFNKNAFHTGDGTNVKCGNRTKIGIEICYSKSGGKRYEEAEENAIQYIAKLLKEFGWGIDRVSKHQDYSGKYCPHRILSEGRWENVLKRIEQALINLNKGGDHEMDFYSPTMREKFNMRTASPATRKLLVEQAIEVLGYQKLWIDNHNKGLLQPGDYSAIAYELAVHYAKQ